MDALNDAESVYPKSRTAWYTVLILMLCATLSYADRQILGFLVGPLKQDLRISDTQVGFLQGFAFAFAFCFMALPFGLLGDRFKRRTIIAGGVFLWSLMTCLCSVAGSFLSLGVVRLGVGVGEAALAPCAYSLIADSFPKERLGTAMSVFAMGIQIGSGAALIIGGAVVQAVSHMPPIHLAGFGLLAAWRLTFLIVGAPGVLVALLLFTVREPLRRAVLLDSRGAPATPGLARIFEQLHARWRSTLGIAMVIASGVASNVALLAWGPEFFARVHGWPKGRTGLILGLITLICGCAGLAAGGRLADHWHSKGIVDGALRVGLIMVIGVAATLGPAMIVHDAAWTITLLVPAVFCFCLSTGCGFAAVQAIFPNQMRGFASAAVTFVVAMTGLGLGAQLPGLLNDHLFHDGQMIGVSISLTVVISCLLGAVAAVSAFAPYRNDYRTAHSLEAYAL